MEHVGVGEDRIRPLADLPASLALRVAVVDRRAEPRQSEPLQSACLVLSERFRRIEVEDADPGIAGDRVEDNLNPVGRLYYGASTLLCTPASLSQEVGLALGAQAGEARLRTVLMDAGFRRIRRVAETPANMVLEARV